METIPNTPIEQPQWLLDVLAAARLPIADEVTRLAGRNESYRIDGPRHSVIVKRLRGPHAHARYARTVGHARAGLAGVPSPRLLHADRDRRVLVFAAVPEAITGSQLLIDEEFDVRLCARLGAMVGRLHAAPLELVRALPRPRPQLPSADALAGLPLDLVSRLTAGEVHAWRLVQGDAELAGYLADLRAATAAAEDTPVHGDLRIDQILVRAGRPYLVDWEEFGAGDPAYDTGSWIGEWIYRAVLDIPTARGDGLAGEAGHDDPPAATIIRRGVAKLDALAPQIATFWNAYRSERPVDDAETTRTTAFAGWHLIDRLFAHAHASPGLPGLLRAAAGIGKRILSDPAGASEAIGLRDSSQTADAMTTRAGAA